MQWAGPGQRPTTVTAQLRLDDDEQLTDVRLALLLPGGWSADGGAVTVPSLRLGQTVEASWTVTAPPGQDAGPADIPVTADFELLGREKSVSDDVSVRPVPEGRVWMREAEDSANDLGTTGITRCGPCSGGEKVRNIGGSPGASVVFPDVTAAEGGERMLDVDYTVNGGPPVDVTVTDAGNSTPRTASVPVTLHAGTDTIRIGNGTESAPDLDRVSLGS
ncbi:NEW3 domain-containing protein [Streptomyces sp. MAR4 CNY-716]